MSNLSKPGVNATSETFGAAEMLRKAVAPGCYPTASMGEEVSPGNSSEVPHCASFSLQVRVGMGTHCPAASRRSVEMRSGLCLPVSEQYCSFNHL